MKKQDVRNLAAVAASVMTLTGCKLLGELDYTVTPDPVEMHGDSVRVSVKVKIPEKGVHKKVRAEIIPKLGNTALKPIVIKGPKATGNGKVIPKSGGTITHSDVLAYSPDMENAELTIEGVAKKGKKELKIEKMKVADGTIITPLLVQNDDKALIGKDNFVRTTEKMYSAQINYLKGKSDVRSSELKEDDITSFVEWMRDAQVNPKKQPKKLELVAYASPEGEVDRNGDLASDRAKTGQEAATELISQAEFQAPGGSFFAQRPKGEDWEGFKTAVESSSIEDKDLIIRVLSMYSDPNRREEEIRKIAATYRELERSILPPLRRTRLEVTYDQVGWSDAELKELSKSNPKQLTVEELLFTASLYDEINEKERVYKEVVTNYPKDWRGHNNLGYVHYMKGELAKAEAKFNEAGNIEDNAIVKNNKGILARINGKKDEAVKLLKSATSAGSEVKYNLGIISIQEGNYAKAIGDMGKYNTFNKGLAQTLNKDYSAASSTVDASPDAQSAIGHYLKAIIAARQKDADAMASNLKSAVGKDATLKDKAMKDREFIKFFENEAFKSALK